LTTANTFTGPVIVNGGTLYANISGNPQYNANFSNVSGITVNSGGTLIAGANSLFGWNGTNDKPITVNAGGTLTTDTQGDVGVSIVTLNGGTIATGGPNANAGTWRFDGAGDKLLVTDNSTVSAVNVKFQNGGCIDVADGKTLTFSGTVTDTAYFGISSVVKSGGSGILVLSGSNTYTGTTTISAGTISISANSNLGADAAPVTINGGTLKTTAYVYNTHPITIGPGGGTININSTGSDGTGQLFFNTQNTLLGSGPLAVTGNGSLTTTGAGNLRIAGTNTYNGNITLQSGGIFEYGTAGAVDAAATFNIANQGELAVQGNTATELPNAFTVSGGTNSVLSFENGTLGNVTGPITLNANLIVGLRDWYNYSTVRSGTISGQISGAGGITVNSGSGTGGTLTLSGANSYTGNVVVSSAILETANGANTGSPRTVGPFGNATTSGKTVTINNGGTVSFTVGNVLAGGGTVTPPALRFIVNTGGILNTAAADVGGTGGGDANIFGNITLNGGMFTTGNGYSADWQAAILLGTVTVGGSSASTINTNASNTVGNGIMLGGAIAGTNTIIFNVADVTGNANTDLTVSARLMNSAGSTSAPANVGALMKTGAGTMLVSGANTYSGGTTIIAGTLKVANNSSLGTGAVVLNGGTLSSDNNSGANYEPTITNSIVVTSGNVAADSGTLLHINGNISGSGPLGLSGIFNGAGLQLAGNNSGYTGTATVTGANTRLGSATAGSAAANWVVNGNLQTDVVGGATFQLGALSGTGAISGHANNTSPAISTLSIGALNTNTTFSGTIIDNALDDVATGNADGAKNNVLALTKVGTGTLTLSGVLSYSGNTTVSGGILNVSALSTPAATVAVYSNAALNANSLVCNTLTLAAGATVTINAIAGGPQGDAIAPVPEPSTLALLGIGAVSLLAYAWRRRMHGA
jgi:autotransporter-associated beta strand protein